MMTQQSALCSFLSFIILEWLVTEWLWHVGHMLSWSMHIDAMELWLEGERERKDGLDEPRAGWLARKLDDKKHNVSGSLSEDR